MENCFSCRNAREKYVSTDKNKMLFYCEANETILIVRDESIYVCGRYEPNLHVNNTAPNNA